MMTATLRLVLPCVPLLLLLGAPAPSQTIVRHSPQEQQAAAPAAWRVADQGRNDERPLNIHYLEIVTPEVDATCDALAKAHGVKFGEPIPQFGNARTAQLRNGGRLGVRAPMRADEEPVVRPYLLVDDIDAAVEAVREAGGQFAMLPTEIPGEGRFAIYFLGGIQHGLWQE